MCSLALIRQPILKENSVLVYLRIDLMSHPTGANNGQIHIFSSSIYQVQNVTNRKNKETR